MSGRKCNAGWANRIRRVFTSVVLILLFGPRAHADEGMWPLPLLDSAKVCEMAEKGLRIDIDSIRSSGANSIADAVLIFGWGGTGSVVSPHGLVLTNHHCAYDYISDLSTPEENILRDGFWATQMGGELPVPGLTVTFVRSMEDVTGRVLSGYGEDERTDYQSVVDNNTHTLVDQYRLSNPDEDVSVVSLYEGNKFMLVATQTYSDIRLVGAPPEFIGKYGGETDNWMWPRHTGDFALFRIYAAPDGSPADYSSDNLPLSTPACLNVSADGYREGDFTMTLGFPGYTERYLSIPEIELKTAVYDVMTLFREPILRILKEEMSASERLRLKYASKYASLSNSFKYAAGLTSSMKTPQAIERLRSVHESYENIYSGHGDSLVLSCVEDYVDKTRRLALELRYIQEFMSAGMDVFGICRGAVDIRRNNLLTGQSRGRIESQIFRLYSGFDLEVDKKISRAMIATLIDNVSPAYLPGQLRQDLYGNFKGDIEYYVDSLYGRSIFSDPKRCVESWLNDNAEWDADPVQMLWSSFENVLIGLHSEIRQLDNDYRNARRRLVYDLSKRGTALYPDANGTMRMSYGSVKGYDSPDGTEHDYYTTLGGILEKAGSDSLGEYRITQKFSDLALLNPSHPVNFLTTNDIVGGNSGSPLLDSRGRVIGLVFDGNMESISGYFYYDGAANRSISVDMRYILFIIDKYAGAGYLLRELCADGN